jgi:hypothetical protein
MRFFDELGVQGALFEKEIANSVVLQNGRDSHVTERVLAVLRGITACCIPSQPLPSPPTCVREYHTYERI